MVWTNDVLESRLNRVDKIYCAQAFCDHEILVATPLLALAGSFDDHLLYLVEDG